MIEAPLSGFQVEDLLLVVCCSQVRLFDVLTPLMGLYTTAGDYARCPKGCFLRLGAKIHTWL